MITEKRNEPSKSDKAARYIEIVERALQKAKRFESNCNLQIMRIPGMSGCLTRHFLNNLVPAIGGRYLEIGVWQGSTFCSALHKSTTNNACVAIDNWTEFGGPRNEFFNSLQTHVDLEQVKVRVLEKDFRQVTAEDLLTPQFGKFSVYLYDGPHKLQDQYDAVKLYLDHVEDTFVYLCDDWNYTRDVADSTRKAISDLNIKVHKEWVMTTPNNIDNDHNGWWNGYYAAVCSKPQEALTGLPEQ